MEKTRYTELGTENEERNDQYPPSISKLIGWEWWLRFLFESREQGAGTGVLRPSPGVAFAGERESILLHKSPASWLVVGNSKIATVPLNRLPLGVYHPNMVQLVTLRRGKRVFCFVSLYLVACNHLTNLFRLTPYHHHHHPAYLAWTVQLRTFSIT